jgi:hypothetical protein
MAPTYNEIPNAITSTKGGITIPATITGQLLETAALDYAAANSAVMYDNLYRSEISLTELGPGHWRADVAYGPYKNKEPEDGDFRWEFDTTGGTKHISQAIEHIGEFVAAGDVAFNHKGVIGVNEDGDVEGVDIIDHNFRWQEHRKLLLANYSWTYSDTLDALTGKVNDATFRGKDVKTVLFEGATGTWSTDDPLLLEVTFHFAHSRGAAGNIGDIGPIAKEGWEYLWVEYETTKNAAAKRLGKNPLQVNIEGVHESGDFSTLGIGTA